MRVVLLSVLESNFPGDSLSNSTDVRIPPLRIKIMLESNPLKSAVLVGRLGIRPFRRPPLGILPRVFVLASGPAKTDRAEKNISDICKRI